MKLSSHEILIKPIISEKATSGIPNRKYSFKVYKTAGKLEIKHAVEEVFGVKVLKVNTLNVRGKSRRKGNKIGFTPAWKKAILTLCPGEKGIEYFDSML